MPRNVLYPEGAEQLNVVVPKPVKDVLRVVALRKRQSMSQIVSVVLEDYLRGCGDLPARDEATA